ncbi:hypothetical protein BH11PSE12_BH11PSE12_12690 [soil metagenome]
MIAENEQDHTGVFRRHAIAALVSAVTAGAGLVLATHYPIASLGMTLLIVLCGAVFFVSPLIWLLLLPALLPLVGLAPWTGWISFEELDMLVLAAAAGGYAHMALRSSVSAQARSEVAPAIWLLVLLFGLSTGLAMWRGMLDAGGASFGWFQGYHEAMNSVRLVKSFFLALLMLPLWQMASRQYPERAQRLLSSGLMLGLAAASLATIWERAAFTSLLNFSADYRTTALFWEMHVGGAALDGFLALTLPFALRELMLARTPARWGAAAAVLALATYSCLTTFSRGVYLAIPVGIVLFLVLHIRQQKQLSLSSGSAHPHSDMQIKTALMLMTGFAAGAFWIFPTSGYRGVAALLSVVVLMLPFARVLRSLTPRSWLLGMAISVVLLVLSAGIASWVPKGPYLVWVGGMVLTASMLLALARATVDSANPTAAGTGTDIGLHFWRRCAGAVALAGFLVTTVSTALVAGYWGDRVAWVATMPVLFAVLLLAVTAGLVRTPLWPERVRWQAGTAGLMTMLVAVIGVMGGGVYMNERFASGGQDLQYRLAHWQMGREMLNTSSDWFLGKGLGRFPSNYSLVGKIQEHTGDYRIKTEGENNYLTITGGLHALGWGEMLRVTQRVAPLGLGAVVRANVRAEKDVSLNFEVCQKHLLYDQGCIVKNVFIKGAAGTWQAIHFEFAGEVNRGDWYAPRLLAFSVAVATRGGSADIDTLALTSADGRQLLDNGDFSDNMAHWFFSSDRYHLPWHIKNVFMNVWFDQGLAGLAIWGAMLVIAAWRTSVGKARNHPLSPVLASSLAGFVVVGLFDSLLDVPRLAWLFYLLLLIALTLPGTVRAAPSARSAPAGRRRRSASAGHNRPGKAETATSTHSGN